MFQPVLKTEVSNSGISLHDDLFSKRATVNVNPVNRKLNIYEDYAEQIVYKNNAEYGIIVDLCDIDLLRLNWNVHVKDGYAMIRLRRTRKGVITEYRLSRVILERKLNRLLLSPKFELADHKDRNSLNNRRKNIRLASPKQNSRNVTPSTGYPPHIRKVAKSGLYEVSFQLGAYETLEEAEAVARAASLYHFGEFSPYYEGE
jgi:hypothetical protein